MPGLFYLRLRYLCSALTGHNSGMEQIPNVITKPQCFWSFFELLTNNHILDHEGFLCPSSPRRSHKLTHTQSTKDCSKWCCMKKSNFRLWQMPVQASSKPRKIKGKVGCLLSRVGPGFPRPFLQHPSNILHNLKFLCSPPTPWLYKWKLRPLMNFTNNPLTFSWTQKLHEVLNKYWPCLAQPLLPPKADKVLYHTVVRPLGAGH